MQPTVSGKSVINYAQLMLADLDNLREQLAAQQAGGVGEVSVGTIMAPTPGLLARAIVELKGSFPLLKVSVYVDTSDVPIQLLEQGKLDIVLGRILDASQHSGVNFEVVDNEALSVVAGAHHPLAPAAATAIGRSGPSVLDPAAAGSPMRQLLELAFREANMATPSNPVETASILTTTSLLQETEMVSVVPTTIAQHYATSGLISILPVRITLQLEPYGIITRKERINRGASNPAGHPAA